MAITKNAIDYSKYINKSPIVDYCIEKGYSLTELASVLNVNYDMLRCNVLQIRKMHPSSAKRIEEGTKGEIKAKWLMAPQTYPPLANSDQ